jgi:WD40 repeat protein
VFMKEHIQTANSEPVFWVGLDPKYGEYVIAGIENEILLYNRATQKLVHSYKGHYGPVRTISISNTNSFLISASDRCLMHWDVSTGRLVRRLMAHNSKITSVYLKPDDDRTLVTGAFDGSVKLWDLRGKPCSKIPIKIFSDANDSISNVQIINNCIYSFSLDGHQRKYELQKDCQPVINHLGFPITNGYVSRDESISLVHLLGSSISLIDWEDGFPLQKLSISDNNRKIPCGWGGKTEEWILVGNPQNAFECYDVVSGQLSRTLEVSSAPISFVGYSGGIFYSASLDGKITLSSD